VSGHGRDDDVPDAVVRELRSAFGPEASPADGIDFDDPAIDEMLGLSTPGGTPAPAVTDPPPGGGSEPALGAPVPAPVPVPAGSDAHPEPERAAAGATGPGGAPEPPLGRRARRRARRAARDASGPSDDLDDDVPAVRIVPRDVGRPAPAVRPAARAAGAPVRAGSGGQEPTPPGGRATIVIGDELDSTGAFDAVELPAPSMDPRVRARRVAVKRAEGRRRLVWVGVAAGAVLALVAVLAVFASPLFAVEEVEVQGRVYTDPAAIQAVVDDIDGEPILLVDTLGAERRLEEIPWVERAIVTTDFPDRVVIDLRERQPLATFQGGDSRYRVIDADGRVIEVLDGRPVDYVLLTGPAPDTAAGAFAGPPFAGAATLVGALPGRIRDVTASVSVDAATGDLGMALDVGDPAGPVAVGLGAPVDLESKLARLLTYLDDGLVGVERLDVSTTDVSVTERADTAEPAG